MARQPFSIGFEDDLNNSIGFDLERTLDDSFSPLLDWFVEKLLASDETQRRPTSVPKIRDAFDCLLANLLDAHRRSPDCFLGTALHERGFTYNERYQQRIMGHAAFKKVRTFLIGTNPAYATNHRGNYNRQQREPRGRTSRLKATPELLNLVDVYLERVRHGDSSGIDVNEFTRVAHERSTNSSTSNPTTISVPFSATKHVPQSDVIEVRDADGNPVDVGDANQSQLMRERLDRWNDFAATNHWVDLLIPDETIARPLRRPIQTVHDDPFGENARKRGSYVDFRKIRLHRVFNISLEEGGRFYGGWWQNIPSKYRRFITINGVPTRELDYSGLHAVMLYAREGLPWNDEDAYSLPGIDPTLYRDLIKTTFFKLINAREGQRIRAPEEDALPPGMSWPDLQNAIKERHAAISRHLHSGIGLTLQRIDSDIAETVMMKMMEQDRLALPVHDSFITYIGNTDALTEIMKDAYRTTMRAEIGIDPDPSFIDDALAAINNDGNSDLEPVDPWDLVERQEQQPDYSVTGKDFRRLSRVDLPTGSNNLDRPKFGSTFALAACSTSLTSKQAADFGKAADGIPELAKHW